VITIRTLRGPVRADFSDYFGLEPDSVWIRLRRLNSVELDEARRAAIQVVAKVGQSVSALADYGLDGEDTNGVRISVSDVGQMSRVGRLIETVEVAMKAVIEWGGFSLVKDGPPAPVDRQTLAVLLLDDGFERRLTGDIELAARILVAEGNVSGSSPSGFSPLAQTASAPNTAATAQSSDRPARPGDPDPAGGSVRKSRPRRKP
jgi:hypothetical protein